MFGTKKTKKMLDLRYNEMWNDCDGAYEPKEPPVQNAHGQIVLSWKNLSVSVKKADKKLFGRTKVAYKPILVNVSGTVQSGTLLGIMGASGSGKTTLMATISHRTKGNFEGELLLNGKPVTEEMMMKISSFVPQNDISFDQLTALEHLTMMVKLKMDSETTESACRERIDRLVSMLGISKILDTRISFLSGGERKKIALAVQLLDDPSILFCDEITTGLDSYSAAHIVNILKSIARTGKIVICTIHQPASGVFGKFNEVILLKDGRMAYQGPVSMVNQFFQKFNYKCPRMFNEADFIISILNSDKNEVKRDVDEMCKLFSNDKQMIDYHDSFSNQNYVQCLQTKKPAWYVQCRLIFCRSVKCFQRDYPAKLLDLGCFLLLGVLLSAPYSSINMDTNASQNYEGFWFEFAINIVFGFSYYPISCAFKNNFSVIHREVHNDLYPLSAYFFSELIISIVWILIKLIIICCPPVWFVGVKWNFTQVLALVTMAFTSYSFGSAVAASFDRIESCVAYATVYNEVALAFCGSYVSLQSLPGIMYYLRYFSIFFFACETISVSFWESIKSLPCIDVTNCLDSGKAVLNKYGFLLSEFYTDIWVLFAFSILAQIYCYIGTLRKIKKQPAY